MNLNHPGWSITEERDTLYYNGQDRKIQIDYVIYDATEKRAVMEKDGPHHFGPVFFSSATTRFDALDAFVYKAARDCALHIQYYLEDGLSLGRFHYDDAEDGFGFMCRFISDVAALDSTGTPILRMSDWAKYAAIPLAVEQAKAEMQSLQALE